MKCTVVKQLANHCVPACLESIAVDNGINVTQADLVARYPGVFPDSGGLNDVGKSTNLETVVRGLGLAQNIYAVQFVDFAQLQKLSNDNEILLLSTKGSKHCVRLCGCDTNNKTVTIMDPATGSMDPHEISWLNDIAPSLVFFQKNEEESC
jgi:hypothetical protein